MYIEILFFNDFHFWFAWTLSFYDIFCFIYSFFFLMYNGNFAVLIHCRIFWMVYVENMCALSDQINMTDIISIFICLHGFIQFPTIRQIYWIFLFFCVCSYQIIWGFWCNKWTIFCYLFFFFFCSVCLLFYCVILPIQASVAIIKNSRQVKALMIKKYKNI